MPGPAGATPRRSTQALALLAAVAILLGLSASQPPDLTSSAERRPRTTTRATDSAPDVAPSVDVVVPLLARASGAPPLSPGVERPLDVVVENPNPQPVVLTDLEVTVVGVRSPRASSRLPCGIDDFRTRPASVEALELDAGATVSLSQAQVPRGQWPRLTMINTSVDQDGCQGAELDLRLRVAGTLR